MIKQGMDIDRIVDLGTQVAMNGAIRAVEIETDEFFDYIVGVAILVHVSNSG